MKRSPPSYDLVLASANRMAGTIDAAEFDVRLAQDLKGPVRVVLRDFVVSSSNGNGAVTPLHVSLPGALNTTCFDTRTGGPTGHLATIASPIGQYCAYPPTGIPNVASTTVTGQPYGNGTYTIVISGWNGFRVFDGNAGTTIQSIIDYSASTGLPLPTAPTTTATNGATYQGHWVDLILPEPIQLSQYTVFQANDPPKTTSQFTLLGSSVEGSQWDWIDSRAYADVDHTGSVTRTVNPSRGYSRYRLVIERNGNAVWTNFRSAALVGEVRFFGARAIDKDLPVCTDASFVTDAAVLQRPLCVTVRPDEGTSWTPQDWSARLSILPTTG